MYTVTVVYAVTVVTTSCDSCVWCDSSVYCDSSDYCDSSVCCVWCDSSVCHPSPSNSQHETTNCMNYYTLVAWLLLTPDHYQQWITVKLYIKCCTLDDKIVAWPREECMATMHCHAFLSGSCNCYIQATAVWSNPSMYLGKPQEMSQGGATSWDSLITAYPFQL